MNADKILIADGATGTQLLCRWPLGFGTLPCRYATLRPHALAQLHREYIEAGADIITANTILAEPYDGWQHDVAAGMRIAKSLRPLMLASSVDTHVHFTEYQQIEYLLLLIDGGADILLFETISDFDRAVSMARLARSLCAVPMAFTTHRIDAVDQLQTAVNEFEPFAVGINCINIDNPGIASVLDRLTSPIWLAPSVTAACTPEHFADRMANLCRERKIKVAGGCCGTTPAHISCMCQRFSGC